jgi:predicted HicB family RNase H-like nuclease
MHPATKNPRGRPPLDRHDPSVGIGVRVPSKQFDALCAKAQEERVSLAEFVRRRLRRPTSDDE